MMDNKILDKLKELIKEGNELKKVLYSGDSSYNKSYNEKHYQRAKKWELSAINLLKVRFTKNSDYFINFVRAMTYESSSGEFYQENVGLGTGVLEFIYDALNEGLTDDLFYKKEIEVFGDLLEQAYEFLNKGFKLASGIYGRIVLETTLREFANKNGINEESFEQLIIKLRQRDLISKPFENSLRANYEIGSWASHGKKEFEELSDNQKKEFLDFIRDKVLNLE